MSKQTRHAILKLAALFEYGELMADTQPAQFLGMVADEVERLRSELAALDTPAQPESGDLEAIERDFAVDFAELAKGPEPQEERRCGNCRRVARRVFGRHPVWWCGPLNKQVSTSTGKDCPDWTRKEVG